MIRRSVVAPQNPPAPTDVDGSPGASIWGSPLREKWTGYEQSEAAAEPESSLKPKSALVTSDQTDFSGISSPGIRPMELGLFLSVIACLTIGVFFVYGKARVAAVANLAQQSAADNWTRVVKELPGLVEAQAILALDKKDHPAAEELNINSYFTDHLVTLRRASTPVPDLLLGPTSLPIVNPPELLVASENEAAAVNKEGELAVAVAVAYPDVSITPAEADHVLNDPRSVGWFSDNLRYEAGAKVLYENKTALIGLLQDRISTDRSTKKQGCFDPSEPGCVAERF